MISENENKKSCLSFKIVNLRRFLLLALPVIILGICLDQAVKFWAAAVLKQADRVLIPGILRLTYVENTGAAFSILRGSRTFFLILTAISLMLGFYALLFVKIRRVGFWALSFVMAGAIGNMLDRIRFGYVIDMFEPIFVRFAIFNVADIFLTLGGITLALYILFWHDEKTLDGGKEVS
jgi:signal peptidase II